MRQPLGQTRSVDLAGAFGALARSARVQADLRPKLGEERWPQALVMLRAGRPEGELGARLLDALADAVSAGARVAWSGSAPAEGGPTPVRILAYEGVWFVSAPDFDDVGYFLKLSDAMTWARGFWSGLAVR